MRLYEFATGQASPVGSKKPKKNAAKQIEELITEEQLDEGKGWETAKGLAMIAPAIGLGGITAFHNPAKEPQAQVSQSTQKVPDIKVPAAKPVTGWKTSSHKDEMSGEVSTSKSITSDDPEVYMHTGKNKDTVIISTSNILDPNHFLNSGLQGTDVRVKIGNTLHKTIGVIIGNKLNTMFIQGDVVQELISTDQPIKVEINYYSKGTKIYNFMP